MQNVILNTLPQYETWDIFKKVVELKLEHYTNTNLWLQAKLKKPLPWSGSDLEESILYLKKSEQGLRLGNQWLL
jgi:hypothetical protein